MRTLRSVKTATATATAALLLVRLFLLCLPPAAAFGVVVPTTETCCWGRQQRDHRGNIRRLRPCSSPPAEGWRSLRRASSAGSDADAPVDKRASHGGGGGGGGDGGGLAGAAAGRRPGLADADAAEGKDLPAAVAPDGGGSGPLQRQLQLQPRVSADVSDLTVFLALDRCLVDSHFSYRGEASDTFLKRLLGSRWRPHERLVNPDMEHWRFPMTDRVEAYVTPRPGVREFLRNVTSRFETHVFTSSHRYDAEATLDRLDPQGDLLEGRWHRIYAVPYDSGYVKDLNVIFPRRTLDRMVLVDAQPFRMLSHPSNGIPVPPFEGLDPDDDSLARVWELLLELDGVPDVRPVLADKFGVAQEWGPYLERNGDTIRFLCGGHRESIEWAIRSGSRYL